ncbi:MAG: putative undecaprenyl-diphosphatase YbjG [candidate division WS2 bacterium ADurb.Bin280]|uniref:Putative undecaprenyl-diphosphatase YbjG n=1 Tax=candidate division WS2 bacterium ADurb.Bin280 TaxID=1852829 RepID=A0A1V5SC01_9BACT|nr:MAG: putative undecaprenyl-diphosphatase YbjG [candidate division WS2 bacterium ADurb.Bin280]
MNILQIDQSILRFVNSFFVGQSPFVDGIVKFFAVYLVYLLPILLIFIWFKFRKRRKEIFLSFLGTIFSWFVITKWLVPNFIWFRPRPDLSVLGGQELLFHRPDYSFPSDHATALFALTFGFYLLGWKRGANWFLLYALLITFFRVVAGVHFPLDIIGGAISGALGALLIYTFRATATKYLFMPVEKIFKRFRI